MNTPQNDDNLQNSELQQIVTAYQSANYDLYAIERDARRQQAKVIASLVKQAYSATARMISEHIVKPFAKVRKSNRLAMELNSLTQLELNDIGLSRSDIPSIVNGTYDASGRAKPAPVQRKAVTPATELKLAPVANNDDHIHPVAA